MLGGRRRCGPEDGVVGVVGGAEGGVVAVHGGDAAEEELADVGDGDGVEARDAFAGELADEVAEERVDGVGGGEVVQVAEEFGGDVVVMSLVLFFEQACVMRAQFQIGNGGEEAAVAAEPVDVAAAGEISTCERKSLSGSEVTGLVCRLEVGGCGFGDSEGLQCGLREGFGGWRDPSPRCFDARV